MKFVTEEIVDAPLDVVFAHLTDFERFERDAVAAGAVLRRTDTMPAPGIGMGWTAQFVARGKDRNLTAEVTQFHAPTQLGFAGKVGGMEGDLMIDLQPQGADQTQLVVMLDLRARSISARILLQSLKLARGRVAKRFRKRVRKFARQVGRQAQPA